MHTILANTNKRASKPHAFLRRRYDDTYKRAVSRGDGVEAVCYHFLSLRIDWNTAGLYSSFKEGQVRCSNLVLAQFLPKPNGISEKGPKFPFSRNSAAVKGKRPSWKGAK